MVGFFLNGYRIRRDGLARAMDTNGMPNCGTTKECQEDVYMGLYYLRRVFPGPGMLVWFGL